MESPAEEPAIAPKYINLRTPASEFEKVKELED